VADVKRGKRQLGKLTKRQLGFVIGQNILARISEIANGVRDIVDKGQSIDQRTGQRVPLQCSPEDVRKSWSPDQQAGVDEFISNWATEPEPPPAPVPPAAADPKPKRKRS
jgi:hypothetical protein